FSEHPGAFTTYLRTQETPSYAGLPETSTLSSNVGANETTSPALPITAASPTVLFNPTLAQRPTTSASYSEASLWGIEEESEDPLERRAATFKYPTAQLQSEADRLRVDQEYWERELDVKMVFNFLRQRFSSRPSSPEPIASSIVAGKRPADEPLIHATATGTRASQMSARRAAMIRQHHPLVGTSSSAAGKEQQSRRRDLLHRHHFHHHHHNEQRARGSSPLTAASPLLRNRVGALSGRGSSSCASQSTKKSKRSSGAGSRNYWDLGGSAAGSNSGVGVWGEA
ncbi:hypothetical protein LTS18_012536, partial [Coniosporium uncinatum]